MGDPAGEVAVAEPPRPPGASPAVASIENLHVTFPGAIAAVRGVSLAIGPGEIVGVVGESGSGKSALGLALLGLLPPEAQLAGAAWLGGTDMAAADEDGQRLARARSAGAVFQDPMTSLNPTMRIGRQIVEATDGRHAAEELLERVGVPEPGRRAGQFPHELSGGLRQRAMIAMSIARDPDLLILDEPTTALDVLVQADILALLSELRSDLGVSILFITHDLAVAARLADCIAVLYGGRLAESGPAGDVLSAPRHPYTAALLDARLSLRRPAGMPPRPLRGEPPDPRRLPPGCPFEPRCDHAAPACRQDVPELRPSPGGTGATACIRAGEIAHRLRGRGPEPEASAAAPGQGSDGEPPVLSIHDVAKGFGRGADRHIAVAGVSLEVARGRSLALVGASGCGKTTLLRMVVGLEQADSGSIRRADAAAPQLVFQDAGASLTPWLTVREHLRERLSVTGTPAGDRDDAIARALAMVGLHAEVADRVPARLSGGQRQRVALARAIVVPTSVVACDEPTSALDVSLAATVIRLLNRLRADLGISLVFVTHDLAVARAVADDIAVMRAGEIVEQGPAERLLAQPEHEYTRRLVAAVPEVDAPA